MFYCPFWQVKVIIQQVLFLWWKSSKNRSHPQIECTHFSLVHRARHFENSSTHFPCVITVIILPRGHVCSVSRWLVSLQNSYIVIASAKTSIRINLSQSANICSNRYENYNRCKLSWNEKNSEVRRKIRTLLLCV